MTDETVTTWRDWLRGARKSWTVWASGALMVLPPVIELAIANFAVLAPFIPPTLHSKTTQVLGLIFLLLRMRTSAALPHR